ncbi:MAG: BMC domain-containing protein, partial [Synergistaceae bacterium]|nr:BMC domain-containing protein [Synergistaceae bacterium]
PNIHEKVPPAISLTSNIKKFGAIGVVEFYSIASAIKAADAAAKAAEVSLIEIRMGLAVGGKGFVTMTGQVTDVQTAVKAATLNAPLLVHSVVIPRPSKAVIESLL